MYVFASQYFCSPSMYMLIAQYCELGHSGLICYLVCPVIRSREIYRYFKPSWTSFIGPVPAVVWTTYSVDTQPTIPLPTLFLL